MARVRAVSFIPLAFGTCFLCVLATARQSHDESRRAENLIDNEFVLVSQTVEINHPYTARFDTDSVGFGMITLIGSGRRPGGGPNSWALKSVHFSNPGQGKGNITDLDDMGLRRYLMVIVKSVVSTTPLRDDAVTMDPKHNRKLFENDLVRVVRIHFRPGESGPMVDKRPRVIIVLTDSHATVTFPDGHSEPREAKAGTVYWGNAGRQATNNIGSTPLENIVVELKGK